MNRDASPTAFTRIDRLLRAEPIVWLSSVRPDGRPHVVPIWFSWDGREILIASKPNAQKIRNVRANPMVMLALGEAEDDFDVGVLEGQAQLLDPPADAVLPASHLVKYRRQMAAVGMSPSEFLATYSQVIRIVPTRYLPWRGRTSATDRELAGPPDRRLVASIRRVAAFRAGRGAQRRRFRSARISLDAFWPGWPVTPPPGCAPEPARYRPSIGRR